ncbi:hypothetical protein [Rhodococcus sp. Q]|uniref:hypothetical protein n=1 Tax=Rhodococcus sp. Q TaxID=2502252 RepID=UPI0010F98FD4|nr:hypothetical protein [Rhodococcus sp. Q]
MNADAAVGQNLRSAFSTDHLVVARWAIPIPGCVALFVRCTSGFCRRRGNLEPVVDDAPVDGTPVIRSVGEV